MKKLFIVQVEFEFAALAEDADEAMDFRNDVFGDIFLDDHTVANEVTADSSQKYPCGWGELQLVYHDGKEDITLGDALAAVDGAGKGGKS